MFDFSNSYRYEVDIWSIGIMIYAMLVGRTPFYANSLEDIYKNIQNGEILFPEDLIISEDAKDLILGILKSEPSKFIREFKRY